MPVTLPRGQRIRWRAILAPPPQPTSSTSASSATFTKESPHSAKRAWPPPFIPFTIIRPKNPSGFRVLLKILLKSPIFRLLNPNLLYFSNCKIMYIVLTEQSLIVMILHDWYRLSKPLNPNRPNDRFGLNTYVAIE